jgi:hypothetical protein
MEISHDEYNEHNEKQKQVLPFVVSVVPVVAKKFFLRALRG